MSVSLSLSPKRTDFPFVYIRLLFQVHARTRLHVVEMMLNLKKQVWPTGPQLLWKRVQSMLFCMLFHRLAFVFAEEALCVVCTPLPLSSTSESTERC